MYIHPFNNICWFFTQKPTCRNRVFNSDCQRAKKNNTKNIPSVFVNVVHEGWEAERAMLLALLQVQRVSLCGSVLGDSICPRAATVLRVWVVVVERGGGWLNGEWVGKQEKSWIILTFSSIMKIKSSYVQHYMSGITDIIFSTIKIVFILIWFLYLICFHCRTYLIHSKVINLVFSTFCRNFYERYSHTKVKDKILQGIIRAAKKYAEVR